MFIKAGNKGGAYEISVDAEQEDVMSRLSPPAQNDNPALVWEPNPRILEWLSRLSQPGLSFDMFARPFNRQEKAPVEEASGAVLFDDWQVVAALSGHTVNDFLSADVSLPLTAAELDYFRRNHRGVENHIARDFLAARADLPSPLSELYGLYQHRARVDAEAALFVAQATGSTRVARIMADLLAIGAFANGLEYINHLGLTYSVPAAFDTSDLIDRANHEAARRLALPIDHPAHLLKLTPDEISVLAMNIAEKHALAATDFLEKANLLSEARQDVTRLPVSQHFATAIIERDLPVQELWVARMCAAYARIFESWVADLPEIEAVLQ
ncbi:MAG: hypothetical protein SFW62_02405 [Alphaproteobacteria bacterium]|nr:hypothetical protein [Alphaproteobacteria bacterium]